MLSIPVTIKFYLTMYIPTWEYQTLLWHRLKIIYSIDVHEYLNIVDGVSNMFDLTCGVPQGLCLGPLLFIIYRLVFFKHTQVIYFVLSIDISHIATLLLTIHSYTVYLSFKPGYAIDKSEATDTMQACICHIQKWLVKNKMKMNGDKTQFLLIGTRQQLAKQSLDSLSVENFTVTPAISLKNFLGNGWTLNYRWRHKSIKSVNLLSFICIT